MRKLILYFISVLEKTFGKRIITFPIKASLFGKSAVKSSYGFWYVGDISDTHDLAYGILHNGIIEAEETLLVEKILKTLQKDKINLNFYDIGANTGYYGILAAYLGKGRVKTFAFEPVLQFYEAILESVKLNRLGDVLKAFNFALGDKKEQLTMYLGGSGSSLNKDFLGQEHAPTTFVYVSRLDDILTDKHLPGPDFVKIDVEGHELKVLLGAEQTIRKYQPVLFIEIAKTLRNIKRDFINPNFEATFSKLEELGYKIWSLEGKNLVLADKSYSTDGVHMFLCIPENAVSQTASIIDEYSK